MSEQTPFLPPFIVLEGDEGTGKSTVAKAVVAKLTEKGIPFVHTREPGGTALGEALRDQLIMKREKPLDPVTHILMHQAYRKEHIDNVILPALAEGKVVLCERFYYSTLALNILPYVQARPELQQLFIDTMPHVAANIPQPLTFIMDIPADKEAVRQARLAERPTKDGYESRSEEELYAPALLTNSSWVIHRSLQWMLWLTLTTSLNVSLSRSKHRSNKPKHKLLSSIKLPLSPRLKL